MPIAQAQITFQYFYVAEDHSIPMPQRSSKTALSTGGSHFRATETVRENDTRAVSRERFLPHLSPHAYNTLPLDTTKNIPSRYIFGA